MPRRPCQFLIYPWLAGGAGWLVAGPIGEQDRGKKTLVLDLDETLVHSSFKPIPQVGGRVAVAAATTRSPRFQAKWGGQPAGCCAALVGTPSRGRLAGT